MKQELEDLKEVAKQRQVRIRDHEILLQRCRDVLKDEGVPGASIMEDHYRLKGMVDQLRKLLEVPEHEITIRNG